MLANKISPSLIEKTKPDAKNYPESSNRYLALDGIRGVCLFLVLLRHSTTLVNPVFNNAVDRLWLQILGPIEITMDVFFCLSGFLITGILIRSKKQRPEKYFKTFYMRRALRILPLHFLFVFFVFNVLIYFPNADSSFPERSGHWLYYASFFTNIKILLNGGPIHVYVHHLWSLAIEEQVYLIWPFIIYFCSIKSIRNLTLLSLILCPLIRLWMLKNGVAGARYFTPVRLEPLLWGSYLAFFIDQKENVERYATTIVKAFAALGISIFIVGYVFFPVSYAEELFMYSGGGFFSVALILHCLYGKKERLLNRLLASKVLVTAGLYSYFIYLFHQPLVNYLGTPISNWARSFLSSQTLASLVVFLILSPCLFLLAEVSRNLLEAPINQLKERFFGYL